MTKTTMNSILSLIASIDTPEAEAVREAVTAELNKGKAKADANRALYDSVKDTVLNALSDTPVTMAELFEEIENDLPEGFTKSKLQYAVTRLWTTEIGKVEGKVNGYVKA